MEVYVITICIGFLIVYLVKTLGELKFLEGEMAGLNEFEHEFGDMCDRYSELIEELMVELEEKNKLIDQLREKVPNNIERREN